MSRDEKPIVWLHGEVRSPPFSQEAKREAGFLLGMLQQGASLGMPQSRPMPIIGRRCHELRIRDKSATWRIIYRLDSEAILVLAVFDKKSRQTPKKIIESCRDRASRYDAVE